MILGWKTAGATVSRDDPIFQIDHGLPDQIVAGERVPIPNLNTKVLVGRYNRAQLENPVQNHMKKSKQSVLTVQIADPRFQPDSLLCRSLLCYRKRLGHRDRLLRQGRTDSNHDSESRRLEPIRPATRIIFCVSMIFESLLDRRMECGPEV